MAAILLTLLAACMTDREAYIAEYSTAVCAYREACNVNGRDVGGEPCEEYYLATMEKQSCDAPDPDSVDACIAVLEEYATACPENVTADTFAACESVCPPEE